MTESEMKERMQVAQDMLRGFKNQRDSHANECVQLAAQIAALQRKNAELEAKLAEKTSAPELPLAPAANGRDTEARAVQ